MSKLNDNLEIDNAYYEPFALTVEEAAELARLSRSTIYLALQAGSLIGIKVGRRTLILPEDLRVFLENLPRFESKRAGGEA